MTTDTVRQARALIGQGRVTEALRITAPLAAGASAGLNVLSAHAAALKASGDLEGALAFYRRAADQEPRSSVAAHNLASVLGDLRRFDQSRAEAERAQGLGLEAPETWLVLARAKLGCGALDEAEQAYRQALRARPDYVDAHRDLAQLIWMRTGNLGAALEALEASIARAPAHGGLGLLKAKVLEYAGEIEEAAAVLDAQLAATPDDTPVRLRAAHLAGLRGRREQAVAHAEAAVQAAPADPRAVAALCTAWLGVGRANEAAQLAALLLQQDPNDQYAWALQGTAWRLGGDPRYPAVSGEKEVGVFTLPVPTGWPNLPAYLTDLKAALFRLHGELKAHPLEQSLRHGSQTAQNLLAEDDPALRAFFSAVDGPVRAYLSNLGRGPDPLRRRNTGDYRMKGVWSVRLGRGGSHVDHVHPEGWISSAFYVDVPSAVDSPAREGWIRFGRPPFPTLPPLEPFAEVRPEPGRLCLFPSYLWHGTVPFTTDETRLTMAFDLLPA